MDKSKEARDRRVGPFPTEKQGLILVRFDEFWESKNRIFDFFKIRPGECQNTADLGSFWNDLGT